MEISAQMDSHSGDFLNRFCHCRGTLTKRCVLIGKLPFERYELGLELVCCNGAAVRLFNADRQRSSDTSN